MRTVAGCRECGDDSRSPARETRVGTPQWLPAWEQRLTHPPWYADLIGRPSRSRNWTDHGVLKLV